MKPSTSLRGIVFQQAFCNDVNFFRHGILFLPLATVGLEVSDKYIRYGKI
jgi:hypothetical protein